VGGGAAGGAQAAPPGLSGLARPIKALTAVPDGGMIWPDAPRGAAGGRTMALDLARLDLRDALDLSIHMEEEARQRYEEFAKLVGGRYPGDAAETFKQMASYEALHGSQLAARRKELFKDQPSRMSLDMLDDLEAPDRGAPRVFMSPRQALEVALAAEQKAFAFFDSALKHVKDQSVQTLFRELRDEEQEHQQILSSKLKKLPKGPDLTEEEADAPGSDGG
jgi:rubrerythrin